MKLSSSIFAVPAAFAALLLLANCSSDNSTGNTGGAPAVAGSSAAGSVGTAGSAGSSAGAVTAAGAGGSAGGGSTACSSAPLYTAGAGSVPVDPSYASVKDLIHKNCFGGSCHSLEGNPLQMGDDTKLYGELTTHVTATCGKLVNTACPQDSALVKVLLGDCNGTPRMPYQACFDGDPQDQAPCIPPASVAAIQAWIVKGAPQQ
jgi:hypothetical protein